MPAATTSFFKPSVSGATKSTMHANATAGARRSSTDDSAPSFMDSLTAASDQASPKSDPTNTVADKPASTDKPDTKVAADAKPARAARTDKHRKTADSAKKTKDSSDDSDTAAADAATSDVVTADPADTTQDSADAQDQDSPDTAETAPEVDPALMALTAVAPNQVMPEATDADADENAEAADTDSEKPKQPKLHLPWRQQHESSQMIQQQKEVSTADASATDTAAAAPEGAIVLPPELIAPKPADETSSEATSTAQNPVNAQETQVAQADPNAQPAQPQLDADADQDHQQPDAQQSGAGNAKGKAKAPGQHKSETATSHAATPTPPAESNAPQMAHLSNPTAQENVQNVPASSKSAVAEVKVNAETSPILILNQPATQDSSSQTQAAASAQNAQHTAQESPNETFDQIVLGLQSKIDPKNTKAEIHLNPPNLGALKVSVSISDGQLTAEFTAQNQMVRDLLSNNIDRLRNVLEGQGVSVDRLAVQTAPGAQVAASQSSSQRQGSQNSFDSQHDGRSNGNMGQQQQRSPQRQNAGEFAAMLNQEKPLDMVA